MALGSKLVNPQAAGAFCQRLAVRLKFSEMQINAKSRRCRPQSASVDVNATATIIIFHLCMIKPVKYRLFLSLCFMLPLPYMLQKEGTRGRRHMRRGK